MMMDNYPPGAALDPSAPYNEEPMPEVEVTVTARLVKQTVVYAATHTCTEYETDPDTGRRVAIHYTECDDLREAYDDEEYGPEECMRRCVLVCRQLKRDGHHWYGGVSIDRLCDSCDGWEEEELNVEK